MIDLAPHHLETVRQILKDHVPECEVRAFGSRVDWTAKDYSDLDLAVVGSGTLKTGVLGRLKEAFEESDLPFRVDVLDWHATSPSFQKVIEKQYEVVQGAKSNTAADGWTVAPLEDCMAAIIDYRGKTPQKTSFGVPLITAKVVKGGRIAPPDEFIAEADYEIWMRRGLPQAGDIVITTEAPLGEVGQLGGERVALAQRLITLRGKPGVLDNTFLKFLMQAKDVQGQLRARSSGTTVLGIKQSELRKVLLTIPPFPEQRAIAHILGTLDDKIELNRQMNETLEAMARAIFKSWFVDLEPVRAKMEGRQPAGMGAKTAALFPDSFEDSALGEIPKRWSVQTVGEICEFAYGKALKAELRRPGLIPVYGSNGQVGWHDEALVEGPGIVVGRKGNPGIVTWVPTEFYPIDTTFYVIPKRGIRSMHYLFHALTLLGLASLGADSAVPGLNRTMAYMSKIPVPTPELLAAFERYALQLSALVKANDEQSRTLAAIRDALLPKLISGDVRVKG
jgi:type I restriction enzyme S subunit